LKAIASWFTELFERKQTATTQRRRVPIGERVVLAIDGVAVAALSSPGVVRIASLGGWHSPPPSNGKDYADFSEFGGLQLIIL
jgi:hypothetical protein